jgi:hypothetical protein
MSMTIGEANAVNTLGRFLAQQARDPRQDDHRRSLAVGRPEAVAALELLLRGAHRALGAGLHPDEAPEVIPANPRPDERELTDQEAALFRRAFGGMPYLPSAGSHVQGLYREPRTIADVLAVLDGLATVLRRTGDEQAAVQTELLELRRDVDGMRRIIGTAWAVQGDV